MPRVRHPPFVVCAFRQLDASRALDGCTRAWTERPITLAGVLERFVGATLVVARVRATNPSVRSARDGASPSPAGGAGRDKPVPYGSSVQGGGLGASSASRRRLGELPSPALGVEAAFVPRPPFGPGFLAPLRTAFRLVRLDHRQDEAVDQKLVQCHQ